MKKIIFIFLLSAALLYLLLSWRSWHNQKYFHLSVCDVGQGDAILIITPSGRTILVDGGPDSSVLRCLGKELPAWIRRIDLLILTHAHDDHVAGLIEVVKRYRVSKIIVGRASYNSPVSSAWKDVIFSGQHEVMTAEQGDIFNFGKQCYLKILSNSISEEKDENDYSVISLFSCLGRQVLLTGDAGTKKQEETMREHENLDIDILKISHHGSLTGTSENLLWKISPSLAVISVGLNNKFNHPHHDVLNYLANLSIPGLRTDQLGLINILANNQEIIMKK